LTKQKRKEDWGSGDKRRGDKIREIERWPKLPCLRKRESP